MLTAQQLKRFRTLARQKGFSEAQISGEIARRQQMETKSTIQSSQSFSQPTPVSRPAPVTEPKRTLGGFVGNAARDVLDIAVNTPIQATKNILGVGYEVGRRGSANKNIQSVERKRVELEKATQAFKKEKNLEKKKQMIAKSKVIAKELEQLTGNLEKVQKENPFVDVNALPTFGELGSGILRNVGNTFGYDPDTGTFNIDIAIQSAYERPVSTALIARDIVGGVKKGLGKSATKEAGIVSKEAGLIEKTGSKLRRGVLNPKAEATPFYTEQTKILQDVQKQLGLKGSSTAQLEQLPGLFKKTQSQIKSLLKKADDTSPGALSDSFLKEIDNANYNLSDLQFSKAVESELETLSKLDGGSPFALYSQIEKYRSLLKSTWKKIDRGTTLLPKEEARLAAFNALKDSIDTVSPQIRALNTLQNQMYNISEGLVKSTQKKGIGVGPIRTPSGITQSTQDLAGRTLEGAGKMSIPRPNINLPRGIGETKFLDTTEAPQTQGLSAQEEISQPEELMGPEVAPTQQAQHPIFGNKTRDDVLLEAFKSGMTQKQLDEVEAIYDRFAPEGGQVSEQGMTIANDLRKEYISETKNNNFREVTNAYKKVESAPNTPTGDISLIFAYMKMLDPGSVVREGEFATAESTAGIPQQVVRAYNKVLKGKRLTDEQRQGYVEASRAVYDGYRSSQDAIDQQYGELARKYGIDPSLLGIGTISIDRDDTRIQTDEKKNDLTSQLPSKDPLAGLVQNVGDILTKITPTASAAEGGKIPVDISLDGNKVSVFYDDESFKVTTLDKFTESGGGLEMIGKILNDVGTKLGLEEKGWSERLGYLNPEQKINAFNQKKEEILGSLKGQKETTETKTVESIDEPVFVSNEENLNKSNDSYYLSNNSKTIKVSGGTKQNKTTTSVPKDISETIYDVFGEDLALEAATVLHHPLQNQVNGRGNGENAGFKVSNIDVKNYDSKGKTKLVYNPFTDSKEDSIDRGLFRINNETFYTYLNGKEERRLMKKAGILETTKLSEIDWQKEWKKMDKLEYNVAMAKIIYDKQGWGAWFAAPAKFLK